MREVSVFVPATSANIGSGFDTMGIALELYNRFSVREEDSGLKITGVDPEFSGKDNLVYTSIKRVFDEVGHKERGLRIREECSIPVGSGLGSSASCIVGGLVAANALLDNPLSRLRLLELATEIEGHPDNVVPALIGGITATVVKGKKVYPVKRDVEENYRFFATIPDYLLSTKEARAILPESYTKREVVESISRAVFTFTALTSEGMSETLSEVFGEVLHEPYRKKLIPGYEAITRFNRQNGALFTYISGAGPTLISVVDSNTVDEREYQKNVSRMLEKEYPGWELRALPVSRTGSRYKLE